MNQRLVDPLSQESPIEKLDHWVFRFVPRASDIHSELECIFQPIQQFVCELTHILLLLLG